MNVVMLAERNGTDMGKHEFYARQARIRVLAMAGALPAPTPTREKLVPHSRESLFNTPWAVDLPWSTKARARMSMRSWHESGMLPLRSSGWSGTGSLSATRRCDSCRWLMMAARTGWPTGLDGVRHEGKNGGQIPVAPLEKNRETHLKYSVEY